MTMMKFKILDNRNKSFVFNGTENKKNVQHLNQRHSIVKKASCPRGL